ncbi:hypothetical protein [Micromonospora sp. NPDC049645]|uniref:hypothetical protein n=1 Tax=Micromonospora sp. NPDC049645 TaxID=3155508 RepID=UPI00341ED5E4
MVAGRSRDRRVILGVAGLALLTAMPAALVAANVTDLWIVAAVTAIAAVAAALGAIWQGRAQRYAQRRDDQQLGVVDGCLVLRGRLPRVREVGRPTWLGVLVDPHADKNVARVDAEGWASSGLRQPPAASRSAGGAHSTWLSRW